MVNVAWDDAVAFCRWLSKATHRSFRLPSEAEWENAARGSDGRLYPWGNQAPDEKRCNFGETVGDTTPVGKYPDGVSPCGALDMAGNVWEWTGSLKQPYPYQEQDGRNSLDADGARALARRVVLGCRSERALRLPWREPSGLPGRLHRFSGGVPRLLNLWSLSSLNSGHSETCCLRGRSFPNPAR